MISKFFITIFLVGIILCSFFYTKQNSFRSSRALQTAVFENDSGGNNVEQTNDLSCPSGSNVYLTIHMNHRDNIPAKKFKNCSSITYLKIVSDTLKIINKKAFKQASNLETLDLSECTKELRIKAQAFKGTNLKNVYFPGSLASVSKYAFDGTCFEGEDYHHYLKDSIFVDCVKVECTCSNGTAASGTDCTANGAELCSSCNAGYDLNSNFACDVNTCSCSYGTAASGASCTTDGAELCSSCNSGYFMNDSSVCEEIVPCDVDEYVSSNRCVACAAGETAPEGSDPMGADTSCTSYDATTEFYQDTSNLANEMQQCYTLQDDGTLARGYYQLEGYTCYSICRNEDKYTSSEYMYDCWYQENNTKKAYNKFLAGGGKAHLRTCYDKATGVGHTNFSYSSGEVDSTTGDVEMVYCK